MELQMVVARELTVQCACPTRVVSSSPPKPPCQSKRVVVAAALRPQAYSRCVSTVARYAYLDDTTHLARDRDACACAIM